MLLVLVTHKKNHKDTSIFRLSNLRGTIDAMNFQRWELFSGSLGLHIGIARSKPLSGITERSIALA